MTNDELFAQFMHLPKSILDVIEMSITRIDQSPTGDSAVQNCSYVQGMVNTCALLGMIHPDVAQAFNRKLLGACTDRLDALNIGHATHRATLFARRRVH